MNSQQPTISANVKEQPDGSVRVIFTQAPTGALVGIITAEAANADALAVLAASFVTIANQRRSGLQVAGAGTLGQLDAARRG